MKSVLNGLILSLVVAGAAAAQDTFTVDIQRTNGSGDVAPGGVVEYEITGTLTDTDNMGLAFFSLDLELVGGDTAINLGTAVVQVGSADSAPFEAPLGYSIDFGGTSVGNDLIQAGGGQNTINNDPAAEPFEPFPSGAVVMNVGHGGMVLFSAGGGAPLGLTVPNDAAGTYTLQIKAGSLHANVIKAFDGTNYTVDSVQTVVGSSMAFTVNATPCAAPVLVRAANVVDGPVTTPCSGYIDPRTETNGMDTFTFVFEGETESAGGGAIGMSDFAVTTTGGTVPSVASVVSSFDVPSGRQVVTVTLDQAIPLQEWTTIKADVASACGVAIDDQGNQGPGMNEPDRIDVAFLPGDIDQSGQTLPVDLFRLRGAIVNGTLPTGICAGLTLEDLADTDRNGTVLPIDLFTYRQLIVGAAGFQVWNSASLNNDRP
jgi:hypothetical protein